jgi:hypothetical protein
MSSEVYVQWKVIDVEQINRMRIQQIAEERKQQAESLQKLMLSVDELKGLISQTRKKEVCQTDTNPIITRLSNITSTPSDEISSYGTKSVDVNNIKISDENDQDPYELVSIDWVKYVNGFEDKTSERAMKIEYVETICAKLMQVLIKNSEGHLVWNQFVSYTNGLIADEKIELDYFKILIDSRFQILLSQMETHMANDEEEHFEYLALCQLLDIPPQEYKEIDIISKIKELTKQLQLKLEEEYVYKNLKEVFCELGLEIVDEMKVDGLNGQKIVVPDTDNCSVFMSLNGSSILFETFAETESQNSLSSDQSLMIEQEANRICSVHQEVARRMKKRGILLSVVELVHPEAKKMRRVIKKSSNRNLTYGKAKLHGDL